MCFPENSNRFRPFTPEEIALAVELRQRGLTLDCIGAKLGRPPGGNLRIILRRAGFRCPRHDRLTPAIEAELRRLYEPCGRSAGRIGRMMNEPEQTVRGWLVRLGLPTVRRPQWSGGYDEEREKRIQRYVARAAAGKPLFEDDTD